MEKVYILLSTNKHDEYYMPNIEFIYSTMEKALDKKLELKEKMKSFPKDYPYSDKDYEYEIREEVVI